MSTRTLTRLILVLAVGLLIVGWVVGFSTVEVPTGHTTTASCGSPWSPAVGAHGPLLEVTTTPEQCVAATLPLAILASVLSGCGFAALIALLIAQYMLAGLAAMTWNDAGQVNLGPRRNPKRSDS